MTDKQIIIDGVDIKDCKRRIGKDNFCRYYKRPCAENNYNCIWKKYLRKEQELQEAMDNYVQLDLQRVKEYNELVDLYKAKEQECEELNEHSVGFARKCQKLELDVCHLKDKNYNLQRQLDKLKVENEELKKTLTEIKKIAEILAPMTDEYENCYDRDRCFECDFTEDCSYFNTKRIIQICDEAINE